MHQKSEVSYCISSDLKHKIDLIAAAAPTTTTSTTTTTTTTTTDDDDDDDDKINFNKDDYKIHLQ